MYSCFVFESVDGTCQAVLACLPQVSWIGARKPPRCHPFTNSTAYKRVFYEFIRGSCRNGDDKRCSGTIVARLYPLFRKTLMASVQLRTISTNHIVNLLPIPQYEDRRGHIMTPVGRIGHSCGDLFQKQNAENHSKRSSQLEESRRKIRKHLRANRH